MLSQEYRTFKTGLAPISSNSKVRNFFYAGKSIELMSQSQRTCIIRNNEPFQRSMKSIFVIGVIALTAMPLQALALDYVQCNAMHEAFAREMSLLVAERRARSQTGIKRAVEVCGLPPVTGASDDATLGYKSCYDAAYARGAADWDVENKQVNAKTGLPTGSPYAATIIRIMEDMQKSGCPLPSGGMGKGK
jgi:hypothetical protein